MLTDRLGLVEVSQNRHFDPSSVLTNRLGLVEVRQNHHFDPSAVRAERWGPVKSVRIVISIPVQNVNYLHLLCLHFGLRAVRGKCLVLQTGP